MQGVTVDNDFARFGAKSYAINKITSVEVRETQPHLQGCAVLLGLAAAAALLMTIAGAVFMLVLAVPLAGFAWWQWKRSQIVEYQLFLITSASETQAFTTRDRGEVMGLRSDIEAAMTRHSRAG